MPYSAALLLALATGVQGHGAMVTPAPRNAIDSELPAWDHGAKAPKTGHIEPLTVGCVNGSEPCAIGQSVFWFSQGCTPGCKSCDGNGTRFANWDHCPLERKTPYKPSLNDPKYRTANRNATAGSPEDIWKFQPWRSPGMAPVADPCGMAGGSPVPGINGGEYTKTVHKDARGGEYTLQQGDLGSHALKERPTGTVWKAGGLANASWYIAFNHGGGYKYRICPKTQRLTEACFQAPGHQVEFAAAEHVVKFADGDRAIQNTIVREGGGIGWSRNPIPNADHAGSTCDDFTGHSCPACPATPGLTGGHCSGSYQGAGDLRDPHTTFPNPFGGVEKGSRTAIQDLLRVPRVPKGEYVLGFRWDCETSSQVWTSCADITIA